jgi:PAS domain S-box-containing protein
MGDGISVYDERLRLINFNQRWVEIWGIPPELARVGTSYVDVMHRQIECGFSGGVPDPDRYIARRVKDLLDKRFTQNELLLPDGRTILVRRFAAPNGIVVINHTDITRIKRAELDAERKSILLETVMDNIHQGILVCDADLRLIAFNDQFVSLLGYEPGDLRLGMKYEDVMRLAERFGNIRTDDLESFIAVRIQSAASRAHYRKEFQAYSGKYIALRRRPMPDGGFVTTVVDITNRKKAEMALQASEERYRSLVMSSTQLIWSTDASGNVFEPLPTWQKFTGQSDEQILGWGWIDALHPDDIEHVRRSWLTALKRSSICSYEYRVRRHDGVYRAFNVRGVPVLNADGSVREWVGVSEDISDRKQAEAEVVAKSMLFEAILQNMAQGVTVYDQNSRLVAWNQRYVDLFDFPEDFVEAGQSHEEILRCLANRGAFGSDADAQIKRRMLAVRKRESYHREFTQSNGRTLFMSHTAMPGGGFVNTFTDISDRKQAERALQDSEERLRAILDNIADAIITTDKAGLIQSCNLAAATIFEYGPDEVIGMDIRRLIPSSNFLPRNQGNGLGSNETVACRKNGALFPIDIAVTSVELPGRWLQIAIVRDIGQQKALQAQLFQASKLATLGEMAAAMAHEMNQPLNVMRMAADNGLARLERKAATEEYLRQNLGLIAAQAERLGKLIMHMRVFSRVDPAEFELFDPRASVAAAVELMSPQIALGNIKVSTIFPNECGEVLGLPSQLEQVMINLLSNAQDAIASNPVPSSESCIGTITVTMIEEERMVRIKVADTGGGIPPDVLGRIFDPFFTTKEVGKGTGLGLSVSYGIIAAMGGRIDVVSSMEGAAFTVILPTRIAQGSQTGQIGTGMRPISP